MSRSQDHIPADQVETDAAKQTSAQHTIGEGTAKDKSGGETPSGELYEHPGTTPGTAEGKEADVDQALEQQAGQSKPKPR